MARLRAIRLTLYGFMLALGIIQNGFAITLAIFSGVEQYDFDDSALYRLIPAFSATLSALSILGWIWMSVLIAYNNKSGLNHVLTTAFPHFLSVAIMAVLWLVFGIMILTGVGAYCTVDAPLSWAPEICVMTITTGTLTMVLWLLASGAAFAVYWTIRKSEDRWCKVYAQDGDFRPDERVYGPMPRATALRTTLYALTLFFAICENVVSGIGSAAVGVSSLTRTFSIFSIVASALSLLTWIWAAVLLSYNRRPSSKRGICRAATHFYSMVVFGLLWLAVGAMFSYETHQQCTVIPDMVRRIIAQEPRQRVSSEAGRIDPFQSIWCTLSIPNLVAAFLMFSLTTGAAYYIFRTTRKAGGGLATSNVAQFDGDIVEPAEQREMVAAPNTETGSQASAP